MLLTVMNPTSTDPTAPPPPQPPRSSFSCDRHPAENFTGFCPSCLCERLTTLDNSSSNTPSSSRRPSSASAAAAAAIKSLFSSTLKPSTFPPPPPPPKVSNPPSSFPELRRTKSFSASKNEALGQFFEPQRKSCDVRVRNTLWTLFTLDDESKVGVGGSKPKPSIGGAAAASSSSSSLQNSKKLGSFDKAPVFEETENPEVEDDVAFDEEEDDDEDVDGYEITSVRESHFELSRNAVEFEANHREIVEEAEAEAAAAAAARVADLKIKDHINLDNNQEKKSSGGGFWAAASVFSKKWHKWRRKQKMKKQNTAALPVEKPISRQFRETQSEIADYGYGRRSCDTDPRFSLDDAARYSFDEPRASWDGHLIGRSFTRLAPMVSLMEDAPAAAPRPDMQIPVEADTLPGGTLQTREYYSDSSSRRRKSLDRSSSIRKTAASVVAEIDELKMVSNAKVSPTTADYFHGARELRDSNSNSQSMRDDCSETFELGGSGYKKMKKPSRRWSWRIWGFKFIHRRSNGGRSKEAEEEERYGRVNGVGSVSWHDVRSEGAAAGLNINMFRSNSCRNVGGSMRKLEKNRSARYSSPSRVENGPWRFYLTPMRGSRRGGMGVGKMKHGNGNNSNNNNNNSNSIARSVLRLY